MKLTPAANKTGETTITVTDEKGNSSADTFVLAINEVAGWQWQNPVGGSKTYESVWGISEDNVFAVNNSGGIMHYDGTRWSEMANFPDYYLKDIWGSSENDVFAVGYGGIVLHYDGTEWTEMESSLFGNNSSLFAVWGTAKDNVFAVGVYGTILHYDGTQWAEMTSGTSKWLTDIWGNGGDDIFVVSGHIPANDSSIFHYDGNNWTEMKSGISETLNCVWGNSSDDVFAAGWNGMILHYDGNTWTEMSSGTDRILYAVWGSSGNDVFAVGDHMVLHYDGNTWTDIKDDYSYYSGFHGVWGTSGNSVFVVGDGGELLHYDGTAWTEMTSITSAGSINSVWGSAGDDVFAVGSDCAILHYDGAVWTETTIDAFFTNLIGIWGTSSSNVFAVGAYGVILHYDGNNWARMTSNSGDSFRDVWGSSEDNIFTVGTDGAILRYNGTNWTQMTSGTTNVLNAVWGLSDDNVFTVGKNGTILHYDGSNWTQMTSGTSTNLNGVWGTSENNVFAVGGSYPNPSIFHYDGTAWSEMAFETSFKNFLEDVWGTSENNVFAVGGSGVLHYDGTTWTDMADYSLLDSIWGSSESDIFAVGGYNTIIHYSPPKDAPPILLVTPDSQNVPATSGSVTLEVSNAGAGEMQWLAGSNSSWLSVSPNSGENSGTLTVNYDTNPGDEQIGIITILADGAKNSPKRIEVRQSAKTEIHFTPVWTGNPYEPMRFWVVGAAIDGVPLSSGDEIAVFDGDKCVGTAIVNGEISYENWMEIKTSQDDGDGNGFTKGNEVRFRLWDASEGTERTGITASFKNVTDGTPVDAPPFSPKADYGVVLSAGTGDTHSISLDKGWNIASSYVNPEETDMLSVVQPLIDSGCLEKVISEDGGAVLQVFGTWTNTIGDFDSEEGYKIKLKCDTALSLDGTSSAFELGNMYATSQSSYISLSKGWNIISYPFSSPQDAMTVIQPLIDSGTLIKVIDEGGGAILKVFGNWVNNIGDFEPGEGYEVKVAEDTYLTINEPDESGTRSPRDDPPHFTPVWDDLHNSMKLWVFELSEVESGDEIAAFDGDVCVGVGIIDTEITFTPKHLTIVTASQDDGSGNGFTEGHEISFRFWDASEGSETDLSPPTFTDINTGETVDPPTFKGNEEYGLSWNSTEDEGHFTPIWTDNPYNRMNLWIVGAEGLESGDEIGVFDGENCVGVGAVNALISKESPLTIITSQDDGSGNGFTEGNDITFRFWDAGEETETEAEVPDFLDISTGNTIDPPTFKGNEDYGITWGPVRSFGDIDDSGSVDLKDAILALKIITDDTDGTVTIHLDQDVNRDGKIGMAEAVYALRLVAGIR